MCLVCRYALFVDVNMAASTSLDPIQFQIILKNVLQKLNFSFSLKVEQEDVIKRVLLGQNCIGCLPTGYGKSLTFYLPPLMKDEVMKHVRTRE